MYSLKRLGLYIYTLTFGHKAGNMLRILNNLTLQKELQYFVNINVFWTKSKNTTTTTAHKIKHKTLAGAGD